MTKSIFYTYKYVWEDGAPYYVGKGQKDRAFRDHGEIPVPEDRNRIIFLIENVTEDRALQHEKEMIKFYGREDLGTGPLLNRTNGGQGVSGRVITEEEREKRREVGKISGNKAKENKTGIFGLTPEERREVGRKNGNRNKENKTGIFGRSPEKMSEDGKKSGKIGGKSCYEKGVGVHGRSKEKMSEDAKKAGKTTSSQKWQCTETGYVSTAGALTHYQKAKGIDISNRIKVDGPRGWEITFAGGKVVVIYQNLKEWANDNGYTYHNLVNVRSGKTKNHRGIIKVIPL